MKHWFIRLGTPLVTWLGMDMALPHNHGVCVIVGGTALLVGLLWKHRR